MSLPESLLGLISRIAEVIGSYLCEFVLGVFALGLIAPAGVRRLVVVPLCLRWCRFSTPSEAQLQPAAAPLSWQVLG
jgi:hypothetical protein